MGDDRRAGLFPALLKHWRGQRGLSQLDLAVAADVSSRHISFLETGRSSASEEMVLRLASTLDVPPRHVNQLLLAAGHDPIYAEPVRGAALPPVISSAIDMMKAHHDPAPLLVLDHAYDVVDANAGGAALLAAALGDESPAAAANLVRVTFGAAAPLLVNFDEVGRALLWRLQREVLAEPDDGPLRDLLDEVLAMPSVPDDWRSVDLAVPATPALVVHLRVGDHDLRFLTTITAFQAPQSIIADELRIETWFPVDDATRKACALLAGPTT